MNKTDTKFIAFLAIIATPFALGAFLLTWKPSNYFNQFDPKYDGYVAPKYLGDLIESSQESIVTVVCKYTKDEGWQGTGWAIDESLMITKTSKTAIMTNHHVIEDCIGKDGTVSVSKLYKNPKPAKILAFDKKNDLALLETEIKVKALELSPYHPYPGYWVVALGSASGYEGSVAIGNVLNVDYGTSDILITNNISGGNSGGPLIDNEGRVIGMVTWGMDYTDDQYNGARLLDTFCEKVIFCQYEYDGVPTWFDYQS